MQNFEIIEVFDKFSCYFFSFFLIKQIKFSSITDFSTQIINLTITKKTFLL